MPVQVALPDDAHARNTEDNDSPAVIRRSSWLVPAAGWHTGLGKVGYF